MKQAPLRIFSPDVRLSDYIDSYWRIEGDIGVPGVVLLAHYYSELVVNFGGPHQTAGGGRLLKNIWLNGQNTSPLAVTGIRQLDFLVVRFKPGAARFFLKLPQTELAGQIIEADLLFGAKAEWLHERLLTAAGDKTRVAILDYFFLDMLANGAKTIPRFDLINDALQILRVQKGKINIRRLAANYGISYRQFLRCFEDSVGFSPRLVARIEAFENAALRLTWGEDVSLVGLAVENEYFDQAHFTRSFKAFAGVTPGQFLETRRTSGPMPPGLFPLLIPATSSVPGFPKI